MTAWIEPLHALTNPPAGTIFFPLLKIFSFFVPPLDSHSFQHSFKTWLYQLAELCNSWYTSCGIKLLLQTTAFLLPLIPTMARLLMMNSKGLSIIHDELRFKIPYMHSRFLPLSPIHFQVQLPQCCFGPLEAAIGLHGCDSDDTDGNAEEAALWQPLLDAIRLWSAVPRQPQNSCPARSGIDLGFVLAKMPFG